MRSIDVYLCRAIKPHDKRAELRALWDLLADDYNKQARELTKKAVLSSGHLDFNKKIIGEA